MASLASQPPSKKNRRKKKRPQEQGETQENGTAVEGKVAQDRLSPLPVSSPGDTDHVHTPLRHQAGPVDHHDELEIPPTSYPVCSAEESVSSKSKRKKKKKKDRLHQTQDQDLISKGSTEAVAHPSPHQLADLGVPSSSSSSAQGRGGESNFELELEWCIAQLVIGTHRTDASKSQKQENEKLVRVLKSEKTPLPRKRQLMRSLFGDYRSRMKKEPLPERLKAPSTPSISSVDVKASEAKGRFFKKSFHQQQSARVKDIPLEGAACSSSTQEKTSTAVGQPAPFCFNFDVDSNQ